MAIIWSEVPQPILDLASGIIEEHHPDLLDARIGFIFRSEAQTSGTRVLWGQAQKVSEKLKVYMDFDFLIWLAQDIWFTLTPNQKAALLDHELCHCLFEEGTAKMRGHDVEEFREIIERYGLWNSDLVHLQGSMKDARVEQDTLPGLDFLKRQGAVLSVELAEGALVEGILE